MDNENRSALQREAIAKLVKDYGTSEYIRKHNLVAAQTMNLERFDDYAISHDYLREFYPETWFDLLEETLLKQHNV